MNSVLKLSLTIAGLCWIASNAMAAILHVDCDGAGDRQAIQDAIDLAVEHDVVQVHGICQLDGARVVIDKSHLTLRGDAFDNDGDGRMDEWQTVLQGNGEMNDLLTGPYTNLGLYVGQIPAASNDIIGVTIENLELRDFFQALTIAPGVLAQDNLICDQLQVTGARAVGTVIQQNRFVDNSNHFFLYGGASNTRYDRNLSEGGGGIPLAAATFALSKRSICLLDPETDEQGHVSIGISNNLHITNSDFYGVGVEFFTGDVELVNSTNSQITGNRFEGDALPVFLFGAINGHVRGNVMIDSGLDAIELINAQDSVVSDNVILGAGFSGVFTLEIPAGVPVVEHLALPPSRNNRIHCNHIERALDPAVFVIDSRNHIAQNRFVSNPLDVLLLVSGNNVISGPTDVVVDASGDNKITVTGNDSNCAPDLGEP